jgi:lysophospholipase L1-like esterase
LPLLVLLAVGSPQARTDAPSPTSTPTLFVVGDSTVASPDPARCAGWGEALVRCVDPTRLRVENHAAPGRTTRSFRNEGLWKKVLDSARPGDFVVIHLARDDGDLRSGSLPGTGETTQEVVDPATGRREVVHTYGWYLRRYVSEARAHGLTPILVSPVPSLGELPGDDGEPDPTPYPAWIADIAASEGAEFIDLNRIVADRYAGLTLVQVRARFFSPADGSAHTNSEGARLNAECLARALRDLDSCRALQGALRP